LDNGEYKYSRPTLVKAQEAGNNGAVVKRLKRTWNLDNTVFIEILFASLSKVLGIIHRASGLPSPHCYTMGFSGRVG